METEAHVQLTAYNNKLMAKHTMVRDALAQNIIVLVGLVLYTGSTPARYLQATTSTSCSA